MNKKGFTLAELIAVIAIIGILALIAVPAVSSLMNHFRDDYYKKLEKSIEAAAREYVSDSKLQSNTVSIIITVKTLIEDSYIDEVKDYKNNYCDKNNSSVTYNKTNNTYTVSLICPGDNYP